MPAINWAAQPALRAVLALATGVAIADSFIIETSMAIMACAAIVSVVGMRHGHRFAGAALCVLVAASGCTIALVERAQRAEAPPGFRAERVDCVGVVVGEPTARDGSFDLVIATDSIMLRSNVVRTYGAHIVVRVRDTTAPHVRAVVAGNRVSVVGTLRAPRDPMMRGGFDERAFFRSRGMFMILEASKPEALFRVAGGSQSQVDAGIAYARRHMSNFASMFVGGEEGAVVNALLTGDRRGIDRQTRNEFAITGTLHVLAVSGLHVAVIAMGLSVLTSWIPGRKLQMVIFVIVLGAYAAVAGAGPSIVRAWCMASCFMLARVAGRRTESLNVLSFSAIVLLLFEPSELFDIGFQLSYAAVAGILLFNTRVLTTIDKRWPSIRDHTLTNWTIRSIIVTATAQTLTAPFLLVHFGTVPASGLILNLPVVPLTSGAMAAAAVGALGSFVPMLSECMGATAYVLTKIALWFVEAGASLPLVSAQAHSIPVWGAGATLALTVWASRTSSTPAMFVRLSAAASVLVASAIIGHRAASPESGIGARVYVVPAGADCALVVAGGDSTEVYASDSVSMVRARPNVDRIIARHPSNETKFIVLGRDGRRSADLPLRARSARFLRSAPIAIAESARAPVRLANHGGVPLLVVSLEHRLPHILVFDQQTRWQLQQWR